MFVTGAAGFIGSHIAEALFAAGDDVILLDGFVGNYDAGIKRDNIREMGFGRMLVEVDLRDRSRLGEVFRQARPDVVVHCAAFAGVRASVERPSRYAEHNVVATMNLLEAMRSVSCTKFAFASSSSVYGTSALAPFSEEDAAVQPVSPYAATKRAGELLLHTYRELYGLDWLALRLFTAYGPRQRPDLAIHSFTRRIFVGEPIRLHGDGTSSRDYTHVEDIVAGVVAAVDYLTVKEGVGEIVNLGSSAPVPLCELVEVVEKACGRSAEIEQIDDQPGDVLHTFADVTKAGELFGYEPRRQLSEGVDEFVTWWRRRFFT